MCGGIETKCRGCGRVYYYVPKNGHGKERCNSCHVACRRVARMQMCYDYLGHSCKMCGYSKSKRALHFHHREPSEKLFAISGSYCKRWELVKAELDKCDVLCANCHAEVHEELSPTTDAGGWRKREYRPANKEYQCLNCKDTFLSPARSPKFCSVKCMGLFNRKAERPSKKELKKKMDSMPMVRIAIEYGVSDNAIRKWAKAYGLTRPSKRSIQLS